MSKYFNLWDFVKPVDKDYFWTFVIGGRSVGKTVNSIGQSVKYCYENNKRFIYLRRWQADFERAGGHLDLPLISKIAGLNVQIKLFDDGTGNKRTMIVAGHGVHKTDKNGNDKIILKDAKGVGYMCSLSIAQKTRSASYPNVWLIIYDEFIPVDGRELPKNGEWDAFIGFIQTVFRDPNKAKALFLANAIQGGNFNSYFINLNLFPTGRITKDKTRGIKIVQYEESKQLINERKGAKLFKILKDNENPNDYTESYFVYNKDFIYKLNKHSKNIFLFKINAKIYGIWYTRHVGFIVSDKYNKNCKEKYILDNIDPSKEFIYDGSKNIFLAENLIRNRLYFSSYLIRGTILNYLNKGGLLKYGTFSS